MQMKTGASFLALVLVAAAGWRVSGLDSESTRASLKGLKAIHVTVENLSADAERDGLTQSQLQTDVELRLRQSGILVNNDASGYLYVNVNALKMTTTRGYAYSISVDMQQPVTILRTNVPMVASTWSTGSIGTVGLTRFSEVVRGDVRDAIDSFINAFLSVNPKP